VICHARGKPSQEFQSLIGDVRNFRLDMLQYYAQIVKLRLELGLLSYLPKNIDLVYELLGTTLMALPSANRLLTALGDVQEPFLEADNLLYVAEMYRLEADLLSSNGWVNFHLYQKMSIAASITETTTIWKIAPGEMIEKWRFDRWCRAMQRQNCSCTASRMELSSTK
jgi:hypothetical protein